MFPFRRWRLIVAHLTLATTCVVMLITSRSVVGGGTTGDFPLFWGAGRDLLAGRPLHTPQGGYIYGPFPALLFAMLSPLGPAAGAWVLGLFNAAALWLSVTFGAGSALGHFKIAPDRLLIAEVAVIALVLSLDKARAVISGGQTDMLVVLPIVLALAWQGRRPALAGAALGLAANIKYTTLILLPYLAWRRQWRACASMIATTALLALAPAVLTGFRQNLDNWGASLSGLLRLIGVASSDQAAPFGDITFDLSVSATSAVSRWVIPQTGRPAAGTATAAIALLLLGVCWLLYRAARVPLLIRTGNAPEESAIRYLEWTGLIVAILCFGPQTQGRHFVLLVPLYLGAAVMLRCPRAPRTLLVLGLLFIQAGLILPPAGIEACAGMLKRWRAVGGASWCLLAMYLCYLWTGLRTAAAIRATSDGTTSPAPGS